MKIINGKELAHMPNGTVFSDIRDPYFDPNGSNGDMTINGLSIMCGHDSYFTPESGMFNGCIHMLKYVSCHGTKVEDRDDYDKCNQFTDIIDTDMNDYTEDDWVVVFDEHEIKKIIENLQWALKGCID